MTPIKVVVRYVIYEKRTNQKTESYHEEARKTSHQKAYELDGGRDDAW